jgi:hypothetical protein
VATTQKPRRQMTELERLRALHLGSCGFPVGSWAKRFAREMSDIARSEGAITDREAAALERLAWTYRRQLAGAPAGVVPGVKPERPSRPLRVVTEPGIKRDRMSAKAKNRAEKLARAMKGEW